MCLAIPAKIVSLDESDATAVVSLEGIKKEDFDRPAR